MSKQYEIISKYLSEFPNVANLTLAKKIYNENKLTFDDVEHARSMIRYYRGSKGEKCLNDLKDITFLKPENLIKKYNLPVSIEHEYEPYKMIGKKGLIINDLHIPFHSIDSLNVTFDYAINLDLDFILCNGDIMDCFELSKFDIEPDKIRFKDELEMTKQFFDELNKIFPKTKIYYKFGNHELRFEKYLARKAPEIFGCEEFRLDVLLDLFNKKITYIPEEKYIDLNSSLSILHGHEYKNGITSPANPARTVFLRTKSIAIMGHHHQTSEHTEARIDGEILTCWSIGCLCGLHPKYMPLNKWNHGFAVYQKFDDNFWNIQNKRIIKGKVV